MSLSRSIARAACLAALLNLTSCGTGSGEVSAVNPTISEMDRLDVQWGLPPRRSRGAPRRTFRYQAASGSPARETAQPSTPPPRETIDSAPPTGGEPAPANPDAAAIERLR